MSKQVNFYADDVDFQEFLQFIETKGFSAIPAILPKDVEIPTVAAPTKVAGDIRKFYLLPPGLTRAEAFYEDLDAGQSIIMSHASPWNAWT